MKEEADLSEDLRSLLFELAHAPSWPSAPAEARIGAGDRIGRYRLERVIGRGGFGVVFAAHDEELGRAVAVKVTRGGGTAAELERFQREAQLAARLNHPNVVTLHDSGTVLGLPYLILELLDGETLANRLVRGRISPRDALAIAADVLAAVAHAHAHGILHLDLKPANVFLTRDGRVKVLDFGLARMHDVVAAHRAGTPAFMAPEQWRGEQTNERTDVFSVGVMIYAMVAGELPFRADRAQSTVLDGVTAPPLPRAPLRALVARALELDPARRFASAAEMLAAVEAARRPRGRGAVWATVAVLLIAGAAALPWAITRRQSQLCSGGAARFDAVWSTSRAAAVHAALTAAGVSWGEKASAAVAAIIDRYRAAWVDMYTDACRATRIRGEQSENALELRMSCLDDHLQDVDALATALAGGKHVKHAIDAAYALPPVAACADIAALAAPIRPPTDPTLRKRVGDARKRLAAINASYNTGDFANARKQAGALADEVRVLDYAPLTAEVELLYGHVQERLADYSEAEKTLFSAALAAEAGGADETAAEAWTLLLASYVSAGDFANGEKAARQAEAAVARLRGRRDDIKAKVYSYRSNLYGQHGDYERAIADGKRSLQVAEMAATGTNDLQLAYSLFNLGTVYGYAARPADALAYHQRASRILFAIYPPGHPNRDNFYASIASDLLNLGRWDEARRVGEELVATVETRGSEGISMAFALDNVGAAWIHQGAFDKALGYFRRALALRERKLAAGNIQLAFEWAEIADAQRRAGRLDEASAAAARSAAIIDAQVEPLSTLFGYPTLTVIGDVQLARGLYDKARPRYERAIALSVSEKQPPAARAGALFGLARTLWAIGERPRALELAEQARAGFEGDPAQTADLRELDAWLAER